MDMRQVTDLSKAEAPKSTSGWFAAVAVIVTLVLTMAVVVPRATALEGTDPGASEPSEFSSQADAIDFYLAEAKADREDVASVSFSSQAEAIDYYLAIAREDRDEVVDVSFSSQAEAIDFYLTRLQCDRAERADISFASQAEAIDYYLGVARGGVQLLASNSLLAACSVES